MKLPLRLRALAALTLPALPVADVGTDHGLLLQLLRAGGGVPLAIGIDVARAPLEATRLRLEIAADPGIELRLARGLAGLEPGEVGTVVIAGMGGLKIAEILEAEPPVRASIQRFVLGPNDHLRALRLALGPLGLAIVDERIVWERDRPHTLLVAEPSSSPKRLDLKDQWLGPILRRTGGPEWERWMVHEIGRLQRARDQARAGARDPAKIEALEDLLALHTQGLAESGSGPIP